MTIDTEKVRECVDELADALNAWVGIMAKVCAPIGDVPFLKVQNLQVPMLAARILVQDGQFIYSWGKRIGPVAELTTVAFSVVQTLRDPSG
jgi:hypothetical protein